MFFLYEREVSVLPVHFLRSTFSQVAESGCLYVVAGIVFVMVVVVVAG